MPESNIPLTSKSPPLVAPTFANTTKQSSNKSKKKYNNSQPRSFPHHDQSSQLVHPAAAAAAVASTQRISSNRPPYQSNSLATFNSFTKTSLDRSKSKPKPSLSNPLPPQPASSAASAAFKRRRVLSPLPLPQSYQSNPDFSNNSIGRSNSLSSLSSSHNHEKNSQSPPPSSQSDHERQNTPAVVLEGTASIPNKDTASIIAAAKYSVAQIPKSLAHLDTITSAKDPLSPSEKKGAYCAAAKAPGIVTKQPSSGVTQIAATAAETAVRTQSKSENTDKNKAAQGKIHLGLELEPPTSRHSPIGNPNVDTDPFLLSAQSTYPQHLNPPDRFRPKYLAKRLSSRSPIRSTRVYGSEARHIDVHSPSLKIKPKVGSTLTKRFETHFTDNNSVDKFSTDTFSENPILSRNSSKIYSPTPIKGGTLNTFPFLDNDTHEYKTPKTIDPSHGLLSPDSFYKTETQFQGDALLNVSQTSPTSDKKNVVDITSTSGSVLNLRPHSTCSTGNNSAGLNIVDTSPKKDYQWAGYTESLTRPHSTQSAQSFYSAISGSSNIVDQDSDKSNPYPTNTKDTNVFNAIDGTSLKPQSMAITNRTLSTKQTGSVLSVPTVVLSKPFRSTPSPTIRSDKTKLEGSEKTSSVCSSDTNLLSDTLKDSNHSPSKSSVSRSATFPLQTVPSLARTKTLPVSKSSLPNIASSSRSNSLSLQKSRQSSNDWENIKPTALSSQNKETANTATLKTHRKTKSFNSPGSFVHSNTHKPKLPSLSLHSLRYGAYSPTISPALSPTPRSGPQPGYFVASHGESSGPLLNVRTTFSSKSSRSQSPFSEKRTLRSPSTFPENRTLRSPSTFSENRTLRSPSAFFENRALRSPGSPSIGGTAGFGSPKFTKPSAEAAKIAATARSPHSLYLSKNSSVLSFPNNCSSSAPTKDFGNLHSPSSGLPDRSHLGGTENGMGAPGNVILSSTGLPLVIPSSSPTAGVFSTVPPFTNSNDNNCNETVFGTRGKRHKHSQGLFGLMKRKLAHDIGTASSSTDKEASNQHRTFNEHTDTALSDSSALPAFENFAPNNFQSLGMTKTTMRKKSKHKAFNEDKPWKHHSYAFMLSESEKKRYQGLWAANKGSHLPFIYTTVKGIGHEEDESKTEKVESFLGNKIKHGIDKLNAVIESPGHVLEKLEEQIVGPVEKMPKQVFEKEIRYENPGKEMDTQNEEGNLNIGKTESSEIENRSGINHVNSFVANEATETSDKVKSQVFPTAQPRSSMTDFNNSDSIASKETPTVTNSSTASEVATLQDSEARLLDSSLSSINTEDSGIDSNQSSLAVDSDRSFAKSLSNASTDSLHQLPLSTGHEPQLAHKASRSLTDLSLEKFATLSIDRPQSAASNFAARRQVSKGNPLVQPDRISQQNYADISTRDFEKINANGKSFDSLRKSMSPKPYILPKFSEKEQLGGLETRTEKLQRKVLDDEEKIKQQKKSKNVKQNGTTPATESFNVTTPFLVDSRQLLHHDPRDDIHGYVVRELWRRSRISDDTLAQIWDLVDQNHDGTLNRESFLVGIWLVDQCLYGRKLPYKIDDAIWKSVSRLGVTVEIRKGDKKNKIKNI